MADVIAAAAALVEPQRASKRIALELPAPSDAERRMRCMRADPEKLEQILLNLLSNAIKFTPPDGRVSVALRTSETWPASARSR